MAQAHPQQGQQHAIGKHAVLPPVPAWNYHTQLTDGIVSFFQLFLPLLLPLSPLC